MRGCVHERVVWGWVGVICYSEGYGSIKLKNECVASKRARDRQTDRQDTRTVQCMHIPHRKYLILDTFYPLQIAHRETGVGIEKYALLTPSILAYSGFMRYITAAAATLRTRTPMAAVIVVDAECSYAQGVSTSGYMHAEKHSPAASPPSASAFVGALSVPQYPYPRHR